MRLPIPSLFEKKDKKEFFLAALLRDDLIKVIIFEQIEGNIKVITQHAEHFPTTLEEAPIEEWVDTFDKAVGTVENTLPENAELKKTVFGVKQNWVEDAKIKKEYLQKLKKVSDELDLQPIGFLVFTEAIIHLLQKEQGSPVSGIIVELGKENAIISIVRAGKIIETKDMPLGESPMQTVESALKHVTSVEILPSRIILFDGDFADTLSEEFIRYPWNDSLPFLHVPQVSLLSPDFDAKAVIYGTSIQLGLGVIEEDLLTTEKQEMPQATETEETKPQIANQPEKENSVGEKPHMLTADAFGFVTDKDIALTTPPPSTPITPLPGETQEEMIANQSSAEAVFHDAPATPSLVKKFLHFPSFKKYTEPSSFTDGQAKNLNKLVFVIPLLLLIFIGGIIFYMLEVRATVFVRVTPKTFQKTQQATFSTKASNDFSNNTLGATTENVSEDGSVTTDATGKKDAGDPAKGTVTVFNSSSDTVSLPAGTTVTAANGVKFTTDKDITVASASGDIFSGTQPGTTDVSVTASDLGDAGNLPAGTKFSFSNNASIAAKNTSAFTGGTKKQITVVSKTDIDTLVSTLEKNLESKAKNDLQQKANADTGVFPVILTEAVTSKKTDKNISDEAKSITLQGTVTYTGMLYDKQQLDNYAKYLLADQLSHSNASSETITETITEATAKKDTMATATITANASVIPTLDIKKMVDAVKGKQVTQAQTILTTFPQVAGSTITFSPTIPLLPKLLPIFANHIKIVVQTP